jgi:hypothetical protein
MPLFLPDAYSPLHYPGETELERETRIFEAQEALVDKQMIEGALRAQQEERDRIERMKSAKTGKRKRTERDDRASSEEMEISMLSQLERFRELVNSKERGKKKEKDEWPDLMTMVSIFNTYFPPATDENLRPVIFVPARVYLAF